MTEIRSIRPQIFPPVVKNLIIVNVLVYIAQVTFQNRYPVDELFALHDVRSAFFMPHQFLTHMFMHGSMDHLLFNMFSLWLFGAKLENHWGGKRFLTFYIICGYGSAALYMLVNYFELSWAFDIFHHLPMEEQFRLIDSHSFIGNYQMVGASGAIFGLLAGYAYLFPNTVIMYNFFLPIKALWLAIAMGVGEIYMGIKNSPQDTIAHFAHIGGALAGIILVIIWNKSNRKTFY